MKHLSEFIAEKPDMNDVELYEWTEDAKKRFWDFESRFLERYFTHRGSGAFVQSIADHLPAGSRVLDFGSGPGFLTEELLDQGFRVAALDLSEKSCQLLQARLGDRENFLGAYNDADALPDASGFDVVIMAEVMEHLMPREREEVLSIARTVLRPGGSLVVSTPNEENLLDLLICNPDTGAAYHRWQHIYSFSADSLTAEVERHGFTGKRKITLNYWNRAQNSLHNAFRRLKTNFPGLPRVDLICILTRD